MELYFSPMACSLASRICIYEANAEEHVRLQLVDIRTHRLADGADYLDINSVGQVPALRTDDGRLLTENMAILLYLADRFPAAGLAAHGGFERYDLIRWLSFIGSELHMRVFKALVSWRSDDGSKEAARVAAPSRLAFVNAHLDGRDFLASQFSVADAALCVVLNWAHYISMDLSPYPAIAAFHQRVVARPAVARAMKEEMALLAAA